MIIMGIRFDASIFSRKQIEIYDSKNIKHVFDIFKIILIPKFTINK